MKIERFPRRHPQCTCPELTYDNFDTVDRSKCEGGEVAHPVVTLSMFKQFINALTRPKYVD
jgi:hypothetical protein